MSLTFGGFGDPKLFPNFLLCWDLLVELSWNLQNCARKTQSCGEIYIWLGRGRVYY